MKRPKLITRKRLKWTGLAAFFCLVAATIASLWLWPSYSWETGQSSVFWKVKLEPGGIAVYRDDNSGYRYPRSPSQSEMRQRRISPDRVLERAIVIPEPPPTFVWLPSHLTISFAGSAHQTVKVPFWIPLVLIALPTGILFYCDRKPKPGCCAKCRYDLTGLSSNTCPECGTKIATTDSQNAPASAAEGENGVS